MIYLLNLIIRQPYSDELNVLVDFPVSGLDLSSLARCPNVVEYVYDLYAVCNHFGGTKDRHCGYTVYTVKNGVWF